MDMVFKLITYGMYIPLTVIPLYVAIKGAYEDKSLLKDAMNTVKEKMK
ncbi:MULTISPECIES: hypothetical protein [Heyndrickxia]|nr:hypothetical protein [Heyndrickxia shackletonii]MBB2479526.1 hypothetical protein [Bacillus sp. APMAM]NEY99465.1 hypothetical protein [Heyndrickxia shackletonii]